MKAIVFDCEIVKAIPSNRESVIDGIEYCGGWHDHAGMGISVIGAYDYESGACRVFLEDNFTAFKELVDSATVVCGFNNGGFDDKLVKAVLGWEIPAEKSYDLLSEVWLAHGLGRRYAGSVYGGFGLQDCAKANGLPGKTGRGDLAPVLWQRGQRGQVVDYCLNDVLLTKRLIDAVHGCVFASPKTGGLVRVASPFYAGRKS